MPPIYHFTHGKNLKGIFGYGELRAHTAAETVVNVADAGVKKWRQTRRVTCGPRGHVCDYVPFYFAPRSPMLFSISRGNVNGVDPDQRPLVYLVSSTETVVAAGLSCVFSDGNAAKVISRFFGDLALLGNCVDWELIGARQWGNTDEDGDRVRRRMAEFLVHGAVRLDLVTEIGVYDDEVYRRVRELLDQAGRDLQVAVHRDWYF